MPECNLIEYVTEYSVKLPVMQTTCLNAEIQYALMLHPSESIQLLSDLTHL